MRQLKIIDMWISIILIATSVILTLTHSNDYWIMNRYGWIGYFVVGGWQVMSMLIHTIAKCFINKGSKRIVYQLFVLSIGLLLLITIPFEEYLLILFFLLFTAPFMAIYYTYICYDEIYRKMRRPLDELK